MKRGIVAIVSIALLISLMLYSCAEHNEKDPDMEYILQHYEEFIGKEVYFTGKVKEINGTKVKIKLMEPPYKCINVAMEGNFKVGDVVEILGILDGKEHVIAKKILVMKEWKYKLIFIRSLPAIPFVLYLFFREWRFNFKKFKFEGKNA